MAAASQTSMAQICCLLVIPKQAMAGLDLQVYSNSINNKPPFTSCQRGEPGRLQLVIILAYICRRDFLFQPRNLSWISVSFYRRYDIDFNPCDATVLFKRIWIFQVWFPATSYHVFQDILRMYPSFLVAVISKTNFFLGKNFLPIL